MSTTGIVRIHTYTCIYTDVRVSAHLTPANLYIYIYTYIIYMDTNIRVSRLGCTASSQHISSYVRSRNNEVTSCILHPAAFAGSVHHIMIRFRVYSTGLSSIGLWV